MTYITSRTEEYVLRLLSSSNVVSIFQRFRFAGLYKCPSSLASLKVAVFSPIPPRSKYSSFFRPNVATARNNFKLRRFIFAGTKTFPYAVYTSVYGEVKNLSPEHRVRCCSVRSTFRERFYLISIGRVGFAYI